MVILNEFTDTGIDTLTLAAAAQGAFDVRTIPGGCLCCTGEEDFQRQLGKLLALPEPPARILIEPSGIGHPGAIVSELRAHEAAGTLHLCSTIALVNGDDIDAMPEIARGQVDAADVVLLAKADRANDALRVRFQAWAIQLFPTKRFIGECAAGVIPPTALEPPPRTFSFEAVPRPISHVLAKEATMHMHVHAPEMQIRHLILGGHPIEARVTQLLQRAACGWLAPAAVLFDRERLAQAASAIDWTSVERMKAVLRTGIEEWHLLQYWSGQWSLQPSPWRQDSRIELQLMPDAVPDWAAWDAFWQRMSEARA